MKSAFLCILLVFLFLPSITLAGGGHAHSHGSDFGTTATSDRVELSDEAISNLGIRSEAVKKGRVPQTVALFAQTMIHPSAHHHVAAKFRGRLTKIHALRGQSVKKGQIIAQAAPLAAGAQSVSLRSPIDGVVTRAPESLGVVFEATDALFDISNMSKMLIRADMYQGAASNKVKPGQLAVARFSTVADHSFSGPIERVDAALNEDVPLFHLYLTVENAERVLKPNMRGRVDVILREGELGTLVPEKAILGELGNYFLYVQRGNVFERRVVELGMKGNGFARIKSGLELNENVVLQGHYQLQFAKGTASKEPHGHQRDDHAGHDHGHDHGHGDGHQH